MPDQNSAIFQAMQAYGRWLWTLTALFALRVIAQPLALLIDTPLLPRFESWHSGVMPYPLLVVAQLFILAWLTVTAWRVSHDRVTSNPKTGRPLLAIAGAVRSGDVHAACSRCNGAT